MTQTLLKLSSTCQSCAFFNDYTDERGRGWCRAFEQPARRHHRRTPECALVTQQSLKTVRVELYTKAVEDDGFGYPVVVDSQVIELTVPQITTEAIEVALHSLFDLSEWVIGCCWEPELESNF